MRRIMSFIVVIVAVIIAILSNNGFDFDSDLPEINDVGISGNETDRVRGDQAQVLRVIDGDTIDVEIAGEEYRVRYVGVNTPERDEPCYQEAVNANRDLIEDKIITLVRDTSETDQYDRLLRYIYADDVFVNRELVQRGYAESVRYTPDEQYFDEFRELEVAAAERGMGCHSSGVFDDGSDTR